MVFTLVLLTVAVYGILMFYILNKVNLRSARKVHSFVKKDSLSSIEHSSYASTR